jgi:hypothetical protein
MSSRFINRLPTAFSQGKDRETGMRHASFGKARVFKDLAEIRGWNAL